MIRFAIILIIACAVLLPSDGFAQEVADESRLTRDTLIKSESLGYTLQYRVYEPAGLSDLSDIPVLYVADGQWYIRDGRMRQVLDDLIESGEIEPVLVVFVDNRNPINLNENRRNRQFFCNPAYLAFYEKELIPTIDSTYATHADRTARGILGLSFGGLNSACFGLHGHQTFQDIAMQSPATHPVPDLHDQWRASERLPLRIFLSSGTRRDNEEKTRQLRDILEEKEYAMEYIEVPHEHTWANWRPLIDDVLVYFYGTSAD